MAALTVRDTRIDPLAQQLIDRAWNAEKLRRQKAAIKRLVTTLRRQSCKLGTLLEVDERAVLDEAARILNRWTGKAERAFEGKHRAEQEVQRRQAQRSSRALGALRARYTADSLDEQIRYTCAIAKLDGYSPDFPESLRKEMRWIENTARSRPGMDAGRHLRNELKNHVNEGMRSTADVIGYRTDPLAELLQQVFEKIDATIARYDEDANDLIAEVRTFLVSQKIKQANEAGPQNAP